MPEVTSIDEEVKGKKMIIFDLDKTLTKSKSPINRDMARLLSGLLTKYKISIISGGKVDQLIEQVVDYLEPFSNLNNLYLQPTSGSALYSWQANQWNQVYNQEIPELERKKIKRLLIESIKESKVEIPKESYGQKIEDRRSQITFSAYGQEAPYEVKHNWDKDLNKRRKIQEILKAKVPEYDVAIGGSSSIDINKKGLNKGSGINRLCDKLGLDIKSMIFIGDRLEPGGNDHSVIATGIDWIDVSDTGETKSILLQLL